MNEQEAIKEIKSWTRILMASSECSIKVTEAQEIAINALEEIQQYRALGALESLRLTHEKQISRKPIVIDKNEDEVYWKCPVCGLTILEELPSSNYCPKCGQRLDW